MKTFLKSSYFILIVMSFLLSAPGCPTETDTDGDGFPDDSDPCPFDANNDADSDGLCGDVDPCPNDANNDVGTCGTAPLLTEISANACDLAIAPETGPFAGPDGKTTLLATGTDGTYQIVLPEGTKTKVAGGYRSIAPDPVSGIFYGGGPNCDSSNVIQKVTDVNNASAFVNTPCCWLESMVVGQNQYLYATEFPSSGFVNQISPQGSQVNRIQTATGLQGITLSSDRRLFVANNAGSNSGKLGGVLEFDLDVNGNLEGTYSDYLAPNYFQFNWSDGRDANLAVAESGDIYIGVGRQSTDPSNHTVWRILANDVQNPVAFVRGLNDNATSPAGLVIADDPDGNGQTLYVLTTNGRLFGFAIPE